MSTTPGSPSSVLIRTSVSWPMSTSWCNHTSTRTHTHTRVHAQHIQLTDHGEDEGKWQLPSDTPCAENLVECGICRCIVEDNRECSACNQLYCKQCLTIWLQVVTGHCDGDCFTTPSMARTVSLCPSHYRTIALSDALTLALAAAPAVAITDPPTVATDCHNDCCTDCCADSCTDSRSGWLV